MAASLGLRTERIYALAFALAVGLAAFGGVVGAEILPIEPYYALRYMVTFLVVVSVAGSGSVNRALVAALFLGFVDTAGRYLAPAYGEFFFYLAVIIAVLASHRRRFGSCSLDETRGLARYGWRGGDFGSRSGRLLGLSG